MKEAMGGVPLFEIVVVFILLFTGIMCLTINHSKAFAVKDEIINIIETNTTQYSDEGVLSDNVTKEIAEELKNIGYRATGNCDGDEWIGYDREGNTTRRNSSFCIRSTNVSEAYYVDLTKKCTSSNDCTLTEGTYPAMYYYEIKLFYQLNIPLVNNMFNFAVYGSTKTIYG